MSNDENSVIRAAEEYQKTSAQYMSMRQLGKLLGVSSHVVGRKLKEVGLRNGDGHPTEKARSGGFVRLVLFQETFPLDLWHQEKTLVVLRLLIDQQQ